MLKGRRGVRAVVPLIAVALLGIAIAAPVAAQASPDAVAAAKKKKKKKKPPAVKTRTATGATVSPLERITVVATCPKGTQVVGGGHSGLALHNVADTSADAHLIYESRRLTPRQWTVTAIRIDNDPEGNALDLTAMAKCRVLAKPKKKKPAKAAAAKKKGKKKKPPKVTEALNSVSLSPGTGSVASTTATCTGKQKALSGGFSILPVPTGVSNNFAVIYRSLRSAAKTWSLSAFNAANATGWTVTVYAYCLVGKATTVRSASAGGGARFQNSAAVTPGCPSGLRLIGGGFAAPQPGATSAPPFLYPAESAAAGPGWRTTVFQLGESGGSFTSYGYCL